MSLLKPVNKTVRQKWAGAVTGIKVKWQNEKKKKERQLPKLESYFIQPIPVYAKDEPDVVCNSLFLDLAALTCISEQLNQQ